MHVVQCIDVICIYMVVSIMKLYDCLCGDIMCIYFVNLLICLINSSVRNYVHRFAKSQSQWVK